MNIVIDGMRVSLELLNAQRYRNMEVIPVRINRNGHNDYLTLKRGIRAGFVEITECEVSTVGTVLARNKANVPLVLIDGDEIVGAKQNRIMNRSLIVPPLTTMEVSVSCTEQGRWHYDRTGDRAHFDYSDIAADFSTRRNKAHDLYEKDSCQSTVWNSIHDLERKTSFRSRTSALHDNFINLRSKLDGYLKNFHVDYGQCGAIFIINGEIKGLVKMLDPKYNKDAEAANFLGKGTITVSQIGYTSPSRCAVADGCWVSLDRRMTAGETFESCLQEIRDLPACKKYEKDVKVSMYNYDSASYTGLIYPIECYFPTWWLTSEDPLCKSMVETYKSLFGTDKRIGEKDTLDLREKRPLLDKWTFSTNGVTIKGRNGVDCIGFGPGAEAQAHAPNEITWKKDLVTCAAMYAALPTTHAENVKK